jgi:hypothetical protein
VRSLLRSASSDPAIALALADKVSLLSDGELRDLAARAALIRTDPIAGGVGQTALIIAIFLVIVVVVLAAACGCSEVNEALSGSSLEAMATLPARRRSDLMGGQTLELRRYRTGGICPEGGSGPFRVGGPRVCDARELIQCCTRLLVPTLQHRHHEGARVHQR